MNKQTAAGWADDPIATVSQDQFERAEYAKSAAELIVRSHSWDSSVVFGLTGAWGSGKSSVVSMLSEHIADGYPSWAVAHFTPWAASDMDGLLAEFYRAIGEALPKPKRSAFLPLPLPFSGSPLQQPRSYRT